MLDFRSIETFLWVVKLGSFRGAAQRLNTTQPAISQRIAQLEREMGVKLLEPRSSRGLADAERPADDGLCREADRPARGDDGRGRRPLGDARRAAARRRRDHRAHLAAAAGQERQRGLPEPVAGDRGRHHAEPDRAAARAGDRARLRGRSALGAPACTTACSCDYPIGFLASPALGLGNGRVTRAELAQVSDHHLSAQDPALRGRARSCSTGPICRRSGCTPAPRSRP